MPLFFTPKPRQFHYDPRFYDPEKEKWEALKQKYADRKRMENTTEQTSDSVAADSADNNDDDLKYFEDKVRRMERRKTQTLGWKDLFRKREMPKFNYQPRFQQGTTTPSNEEQTADADYIADKYDNNESKHKVRIRRRYNIEDPEYMKPMPAGKIMIYGLLTFLLLFWILF